MKKLLLTIVVLTLGHTPILRALANHAGRWQYPVDTTVARTTTYDSLVTLDDALELVRLHNPIFPSFERREESVRHLLDQSGRWPNPEIEVELEEISWDSPGLSESEMTVAISQEFELFGQRSARKRVAQAELDAARLHTRFSAFDLYLETKRMYFTLAHTQEEYCLSEMAVTLAEEIVEDAELRIREGAASQSEVLLARMELKRATLTRAEASQRREQAQIALASMWNDSSPENLVVALLQPDFEEFRNRLQPNETLVDSAREVLALEAEKTILDSERDFAGAEAKPNITFRGGYRRLNSDGSDSFLLGLSLPVPFFNRNQGTRSAITARLQALEFERQNLRQRATAELKSGFSRLHQLMESYAIIDSELLPTAEEAFQSMEKTYKAGRLPYTSILEAGRSLIELRFEHNDVLLAIYEQIISLEQLTGARISAVQR